MAMRPPTVPVAPGATMPAAARLRYALARTLPPLLLALALAAAGLGLERGWAGWREQQANAALIRGEAPAGSPPRLLLAQAIAHERAGRIEAALSTYAEAEVLSTGLLRHAVRVNVANLYLRRGIVLALEEGNTSQALVLLQLAKASYRRALREVPDDWNARYNLELAQRLLPDFEVRNWKRGDESSMSDDPDRNRAAWTELVGPPRGMH